MDHEALAAIGRRRRVIAFEGVSKRYASAVRGGETRAIADLNLRIGREYFNA